MKKKRVLHISAGGMNTRIKELLDTEYGGIPKHLLPLPRLKTNLIGHILRCASGVFDKSVLWVGEHNQMFFKDLESDTVMLEVDSTRSGPLGPMIRNLLTTEKRTYGCAGDHFAELDWEAFERFHDGHEFPISILVAQSIATAKGAKFNLNGQYIESWERTQHTEESDWINIGAYIVDPHKDLFSFLSKMTYHKEDEFFDWTIPRSLVAGYALNKRAFNINGPDSYRALLAYLGD